jgi:hypothetical protein
MSCMQHLGEETPPDLGRYKRAEVFQPKSGWNPDKSTSDHKPVLRSQPGGCGRLCKTAGEYLWRLEKRSKGVT